MSEEDLLNGLTIPERITYPRFQFINGRLSNTKIYRVKVSELAFYEEYIVTVHDSTKAYLSDNGCQNTKLLTKLSKLDNTITKAKTIYDFIKKSDGTSEQLFSSYITSVLTLYFTLTASSSFVTNNDRSFLVISGLLVVLQGGQLIFQQMVANKFDVTKNVTIRGFLWFYCMCLLTSVVLSIVLTVFSVKGLSSNLDNLKNLFPIAYTLNSVGKIYPFLKIIKLMLTELSELSISN